MTPFLFVYGTLLPNSEGKLGLRQRNRLRGESSFLGPAHTAGVLLDLGDYPGLMHGAETVHGGVFRLHDTGTTLPWLDTYECLTGSDRDEYVRRQVEVTLVGGQSLIAWTYVFIGNSHGLCKITSGRWQHRTT